MSSFAMSACIRFMVGWLHLHLNKQTVESEPRRQTQEREKRHLGELTSLKQQHQ
jgi:hypothetical protein